MAIVPIPINFNEVEIGAIPTTLYVKKSKVGIVPIPINFNEVEIGAIPTTLYVKKSKVGIVPIPINFNEAALDSLSRMKVISAAQAAVDKKKTKTWAEIGAVPIPINRSKAVPILINFDRVEIGAVQTTT